MYDLSTGLDRTSGIFLALSSLPNRAGRFVEDQRTPVLVSMPMLGSYQFSFSVE